MNLDLTKDRTVTHAFTNYLSASYEGKFARLNILSQLKSSRFKPDEITKTQKILQSIHTWTTQLYKDECLMSAQWTTAETFDAQHAVNLLETLRTELFTLAGEVGRILASTVLPPDDDIKLLLAALAQSVYSRDSYIRGFIEFGKKFGPPEMVQAYSTLLPEASEDIRKMHNFLNYFQSVESSAAKCDPNFLLQLHHATLDLPGIFNTHIHDINQILAPFKGGLNFTKAGFSQPEADEWQNASFGVVVAGYWRAYLFTPQDAQAWIQIKMADPTLAHEWRKYGFAPSVAESWFQAGFTADYAKVWFQAGYDSKQAMDLINAGTKQPPKKE